MSSKWRVLLTDLPWGDSEIERSILGPASVETVEAPDESEATLSSLAHDVDAIATCWAKVTKGVIDAAPKCRHIARMGIGLDNIDLKAAAARGICVTNVPDYCVSEVADHTLALLLAAARNVAFFHHRIMHGEYDLTAGPPMHRLKGRVLGLVGFGRIAQAVHSRAKAFGMDVVATSSSGNNYGTGCRIASLQALLSNSDFISLHAPLTAATKHLLGPESLRWLKPTAVVINTSRGGLIDQAALWEAIRTNRLAGAALDVFEREPPDINHPLFVDERVITTPHAAFISEESLVELRQRVARQILDVLEGRTPESVVPLPV
jgi:D-3-phosphoglycerate dehydrogenase / 2-oxoglutarate reductase